MKDNKKEIRRLIRTMHLDSGNLEFCYHNHIINGTLLMEIERIMQEYANQEAEKARIEGIKEGFSEAKKGHYGGSFHDRWIEKWVKIEDYLNSRKDAKED